MANKWIITDEDNGSRLDIFLRDNADGTNRSALAKQIKAGNVKVNKKITSVHHFLKTGDTVEIDLKAPKIKEEKQSKKDTASLPSLEIIKETSDWIVINKQSGLLVHPDSKQKVGTLVDLLVTHAPEIRKIGEDPSRPGIMHRLDREVSGLMVIAKTQDTFDGLKKQFAEHSVEKTYLALAYGTMAKKEGDIKFRIARSKTYARMAAIPENEDSGQAAWTHYKVLKQLRTAALMELEIYTGRTHQIRVHLQAMGNPIIGDVLYKPGKNTKKIETPRMLLQAVRLCFIDPITNKKETFTLSPDPAFDKVMNTLTEL